MERKYPKKLFWMGVVTNFLFHFIYLSLPGIILSIIGIWVKPCLWIGLGVLCLDLVLSFAQQFRIRKAALTPSENPEFNELMEALTGPGGLEDFGKLLDAKIKSTPPVEINEEQDG